MPKTKSLCLFLALVFLLPACGQEEGNALIIRSKDFPFYDRAIEGFKNIFQGTGKIVTMESPTNDEKLQAEIHDANPRVILAVGLKAAKWVKENAGDVPAVFCMAIHPDDNQLKTESMTGVHLEPSPEDQLRAISNYLPQAVKIGLIYDPGKTGRQVEAIQEAAGKQGPRILTRPVKTREEVPAALQEILDEVQVLWLLRDSTVLTREFFNQTLYLQLSRRIPVIAYSDQFVRKGAFASFSASYEKQGEKAGDLANQILTGTSPADIPLKHPGGALTVNLDIGQKMGLVVPVYPGRLPREKVYRVE